MKGKRLRFKMAGVAAGVLAAAGTVAMITTPAHAAEARPAWSIGHGSGKGEVFYVIASYHDLHNLQGAMLAGLKADCTAISLVTRSSKVGAACNAGVAYLSAHRSNDNSSSHGVWFAVYTTSPHLHEGAW
jgi:hypothetical protein